MQQHLFLLSTLTVLASASSRWGTTSRSSHTVEWRIDLHNNVTYSQNESELGNKKGEFVKFSESSLNHRHQGKERRLVASHRNLHFDDDGVRGRRGSKRSSSYDNIFDHHSGKGGGKGGSYYGDYYYGKSSSSSSYYSYGSSKSSKRSGKGGKGYYKGGYDDDDDGNGGDGGGDGDTAPPTLQPTMTATTQPPTMPLPPTTPAPTTPFIETPSPTIFKRNPTVAPAPVQRPPTRSPRTPSPTVSSTSRNCVVNQDGLFGAQLGNAEVIRFAYELDVFDSPSTEQLISMVSAMEEGISNAIVPDLFAACSASSSLSELKETPQKQEDQRQHHHVGSGLFPTTTTATTTTFQNEQGRHSSHPGGGDSFTTSASLEWDTERRHNHRSRNGHRDLQQSRLYGLSSRPKDVVVDVGCSGIGLGFQCVPVNAQLTVYSQGKLDLLTIGMIESSIERAVSSGGLDTLDNRIYRINYRDLDRYPFPDSIDEDTPSPTLSPTRRPRNTQPQVEESSLPLPLWAIITIATAGGLLLIVLFVFFYLRRKNKSADVRLSLSNRVNDNSPNRPGSRYRPPPSNLKNNAFGRPAGTPPNRPNGPASDDTFGKSNPHPSTDFGRPNPHPSPFKPDKRLGVEQGGRQTRPVGPARPNLKPPLTSSQAGPKPPPPRVTTPPGQRNFLERVSTKSSGPKPTSTQSLSTVKTPEAAAARKAAYGLGPIKSPAPNRNAAVTIPMTPTAGNSLFSGVSPGNKSLAASGSASVGGGPQPFGANASSHKLRRNSVSGYSAAGAPNPSVEGFNTGNEPSSGSGSSEEIEVASSFGSRSEESEIQIELTESERNNATSQNAANKQFGDPDNAFGDADNAFGIAMNRNSLVLQGGFSSSSSYEEEVEEEYEIEYVEEDEDGNEEGGFQSSSADAEFWDDEVVEEVVDDPDQPILGGWTSSS